LRGPRRLPGVVDSGGQTTLGVRPTGMGFSRPCRLSRGCVGSWPFTDAALHVLRCIRAAPADSKAFTSARSPPSWTGDFEDLTPARIGWEVSFSIQRRPWSFLPPLPCDCLTQLHREPRFPCGTARARLRCLCWVVQRSPLHRSTLQESTPSTFRCLRGGGCHRALARPAFVPTSPFSRPRRLSPRASYRGIAPGPDPGVRTVSCQLGSRLANVSRCAFPPFEAFLPAARCPLRSRAGCGGSSPPRRCRRGVHRTPSLLVLRSPPLSRPPAGTSRVSSFCGAVPPCTVSSADRPLLPWACQSYD